MRTDTSKKIIGMHEARSMLGLSGMNLRRIVLASGIFDLLHPGHFAYLEFSATLGDTLVVGVNTDESARRARGRPPHLPLTVRACCLAALTVVDAVVPFDDDHPGPLIRALRPVVFVKGADYRGRRVPEEADLAVVGCKYVIAPTEKSFSSRAFWDALEHVE